MHSRRFWIISENECRRQMTSYHITATVQDAPRDVGSSAIGRRVKVCKDSWRMSVSKWFADDKEDTGLQTAENSKFFGIASSIKSFSNESKELIIQYQAKSSLCQASSSKPKCLMQRTPGSLIRSLKCLSKCCATFNPTCDQEECDC